LREVVGQRIRQQQGEPGREQRYDQGRAADPQEQRGFGNALVGGDREAPGLLGGQALDDDVAQRHHEDEQHQHHRRKRVRRDGQSLPPLEGAAGHALC
jgi:hypothetical protein